MRIPSRRSYQLLPGAVRCYPC